MYEIWLDREREYRALLQQQEVAEQLKLAVAV